MYKHQKHLPNNMCRSCKKSFLFENDDACNKRFTNRATRFVLGNMRPDLFVRFELLSFVFLVWTE